MPETAIGKVQVLYGRAWVESGGEQRLLEQGSTLFQGDTVITGDDSALEVEFADGTRLSQSEKSTVSIDTYVFDPDSGAGNVLLQLTEGTFRTVTGAIVDSNPEKFKVQSPLATIGIRGTTTGHFVSGPNNPVPPGAAPENHGVLNFDGKPVVVQSNFGGTPAFLTQSGVNVGASTSGLGSTGAYTAQQMDVFDSLSSSQMASAPPMYDSSQAFSGGDSADDAPQDDDQVEETGEESEEEVGAEEGTDEGSEGDGEDGEDGGGEGEGEGEEGGGAGEGEGEGGEGTGEGEAGEGTGEDEDGEGNGEDEDGEGTGEEEEGDGTGEDGDDDGIGEDGDSEGSGEGDDDGIGGDEGSSGDDEESEDDAAAAMSSDDEDSGGDSGQDSGSEAVVGGETDGGSESGDDAGPEAGVAGETGEASGGSDNAGGAGGALSVDAQESGDDEAGGGQTGVSSESAGGSAVVEGGETILQAETSVPGEAGSGSSAEPPVGGEPAVFDAISPTESLSASPMATAGSALNLGGGVLGGGSGVLGSSSSGLSSSASPLSSANPPTPGGSSQGASQTGSVGGSIAAAAGSVLSFSASTFEGSAGTGQDDDGGDDAYAAIVEEEAAQAAADEESSGEVQINSEPVVVVEPQDPPPALESAEESPQTEAVKANFLDAGQTALLYYTVEPGAPVYSCTVLVEYDPESVFDLKLVQDGVPSYGLLQANDDGNGAFRIALIGFAPVDIDETQPFFKISFATLESIPDPAVPFTTSALVGYTLVDPEVVLGADSLGMEVYTWHEIYENGIEHGVLGGNYVDFSGWVPPISSDVAAVTVNLDPSAGPFGDFSAPYVIYTDYPLPGDNHLGDSLSTSIDHVVGTGNDDDITGNSAGNRLVGMDGDDTIHGGDGDDFINGGVQNSFGASDGDDVLYGEGGDDFFYGSAGVDQIFGGTGTNSLVYSADGNSAATGVEFNLGATGTAVMGTETTTFQDVQYFRGTDQADTFINGTPGAFTLEGGAGADVFVWQDSNDVGIGNVDTIVDFIPGADELVFNVGTGGFPGTTVFEVGAAASSSVPTLFYDPSLDTIFYDEDGSEGVFGPEPVTEFAGNPDSLNLGDVRVEVFIP